MVILLEIALKHFLTISLVTINYDAKIAIRLISDIFRFYGHYSIFIFNSEATINNFV